MLSAIFRSFGDTTTVGELVCGQCYKTLFNSSAKLDVFRANRIFA
jgi:hypothetical protein